MVQHLRRLAVRHGQIDPEAWARLIDVQVRLVTATDVVRAVMYGGRAFVAEGEPETTRYNAFHALSHVILHLPGRGHYVCTAAPADDEHRVAEAEADLLVSYVQGPRALKPAL